MLPSIAVVLYLFLPLFSFEASGHECVVSLLPVDFVRAWFKFYGMLWNTLSQFGLGDKREINIDTSRSPDRSTKAIFRNMEPQRQACSVILTAGK